MALQFTDLDRALNMVMQALGDIFKGILVLFLILIAIGGFLGGISGLLDAVREDRTVVDNIAMTCSFILGVISVHCIAYLGRGVREDNSDED